MSRHPFQNSMPLENMSPGLGIRRLPSEEQAAAFDAFKQEPSPSKATQSLVMQTEPKRMLGMLEFGMESLFQTKTDIELATLLDCWMHCSKEQALVFHAPPARDMAGELTEAHISFDIDNMALKQPYAVGQYQLFSSRARDEKERTYWAHRLDKPGSFFLGKREAMRAVCFEFVDDNGHPLISIHPLIILKARQFIALLSKPAQPSLVQRLLPQSLTF
jgi:hypothetical protein